MDARAEEEKTQVKRDRAYRSLGPRNLLRGLAKDDQVALWALLVFYDRFDLEASDIPAIRELEEVSQLAKKFQDLAVEIDTHLINGLMSEPLIGRRKSYRVLSAGLDRLGRELQSQMTALGKAGHKGRTAATKQLVTASEFVRSRLGSFCDEDLAELFQAVRKHQEDLSDLSGDSIRKRRHSFREIYPEFYQDAKAQAEKL